MNKNGCEETIDDDIDNWKPMSDDYNSVHFNSYMTGQPGAQLLSAQHNSSSNESLRLFISGLPTDLTESGLNAYLRRIGCKPVNVSLIRVSSRHNKPYGIVDFDGRRTMLSALQLIQSNRNLFKLKATIVASEQQMQRNRQAVESELLAMRAKQKPITE